MWSRAGEEKMFHQPLEPVVHPGEMGGRVDGDELVVPCVDVDSQQPFPVEWSVKRQQQADVDDVGPPTTVGIW